MDETPEDPACPRRLQIPPAGGKARGQVNNLLPFVHIIKQLCQINANRPVNLSSLTDFRPPIRAILLVRQIGSA